MRWEGMHHLDDVASWQPMIAFTKHLMAGAGMHPLSVALHATYELPLGWPSARTRLEADCKRGTHPCMRRCSSAGTCVTGQRRVEWRGGWAHRVHRGDKARRASRAGAAEAGAALSLRPAW